MAQKYLFIAIFCAKMSRVNKALNDFYIENGLRKAHLLSKVKISKGAYGTYSRSYLM